MAKSRPMMARDWIKSAEAGGWRVATVSAGAVTLSCVRHGCPGTLRADLDKLGAPPAPCALPHNGRYSTDTYDAYESLVDELRRRRCQIGLDQIDLSDALGLADGYVSKLEALARIPSPPTLIMWAKALGLSITVTPAPLPPATLKAIDDRRTRPYAQNSARFKRP